MLALPCVTVGRHDGSPPPDARGFDVLLGPDEADLLEPLVGAVEAHPLAAAALAVLLRGTERRTIEDGLAAESAVYSLLQAGPEFGAWRAGHPARPVAPEPGPAVIVERDERSLRVTLNRPRQLNAYNNDLDQFAALDAQVLGISAQSVDSHDTFAGKHGFDFPLLADPDKAVAAAYGTLGPIGFPRRSVFIVDGAGVIRYAHRAIAGLTYRPVSELIDELRKISA